ncbi:MAG: cytidine/deoxycytidylate deaminase family protein [Patescibacteria group bacterium]
MSEYIRPNWPEYFMGIVDAVAKRGTCERGRSGAIIVIDKRIITTGYVGSEPGAPHCDDVGHLFEEVIHADGTKTMHCVRTLHAEENAIIQAAEFGVPIKGGTLYCTMVPCDRCSKRIVRVGLRKVVAKRRYHVDKRTLERFHKASIQLSILEDKVEKYDDQ